MRYKVQGSDLKTGKPLAVVIEADSAGDAMALARERGLRPRSVAAVEEGEKVADRFLVSSGDAGRPFRVLQLVVGFASAIEDMQGGNKAEGVYQKALDRLAEGARAQGADAVLFVRFQSRTGHTIGCAGLWLKPFEVFAWGTAVRWVTTDE